MLNNFVARPLRSFILEMEDTAGVIHKIPVTEFAYQVTAMNNKDFTHLPAYVVLFDRNEDGYYQTRYEVNSYKLHRV